MATDEQLRSWGLDRLIDEPASETEAVTRWRRLLADVRPAPPDPRSEALAELAADPHLGMGTYAELREQVLAGAGTDGQYHASLSRWSR